MDVYALNNDIENGGLIKYSTVPFIIVLYISQLVYVPNIHNTAIQL